MKSKIYTLFLFLLMIGFVGCTEVIDITTRTADAQLVVDGGVSDGNPAQILLTKSIGLTDENDFPRVENALVILTNSRNESDTLLQMQPGIYMSGSVKGEIGETYQLYVKSDDQEVTAECRMPEKVAIDTFYVNSVNYSGAQSISDSESSDIYELTVGFSDPKNTENYYRLIVYQNGVAISGRVFNDQLIDGLKTEVKRYLYQQNIKTGDMITVELQSIDKAIYEYFNSISNSSMGSSPANPYTNLTGTELGYFSAYSSDKRTYMIP